MSKKTKKPTKKLASDPTKSRQKALTRPVEGVSDYECRLHGLTVESAFSYSRDEVTGKVRKNGGGYLKCPKYSECGYYVSPGSGTRPMTNDEGVAMGRTLRKK